MTLFKNFNRDILLENTLLGFAQILLWGGSFFLLSVLGEPMMKESGFSHQLVYGSLSASIFISGIVSPMIGKIINKGGKNYILLFSGVVMASGLIILSLAENEILFILSWIVIGLAMGMGLYDALFASLGEKYGKGASRSIVQITLISGFATTVAWPLLAMLNENFGWRKTVLMYAIILMLLTFLIHWFTIFKNKTVINATAKTNDLQKTDVTTTHIPNLKNAFHLLLINFTIGSFLMTGIYIYLLDILKNNQFSLEQAISIGALLGPSQVGVRVLDILFPKKTPISTGIISSIAITIGLIFLTFCGNSASIGVVIFGLGNGMRSILRGTLPLEIFGQKIYALMIGKLAILPLVAQAVTPLIGGLVIQYFDVSVFVYLMCALAIINIVPMILLKKVMNGKSFKFKSIKMLIKSN